MNFVYPNKQTPNASVQPCQPYEYDHTGAGCPGQE